MSKHTPAPWALISTDVRREQMNNHFFSATFAIIIGNLGHKITMEGGTFNIDEFIANALLIAAAPELLEALKLMVKITCRTQLEGLSEIDLACKAIAKAEGSI